jgi:hypothetical protein
LDLLKLLKPRPLKIGGALVIPAVVGLLVTRRIESTIDFYGYLLTPMISHYNGNSIYYTFNVYFLLWMPFYLIACAIVLPIRQIRMKCTHRMEGNNKPARATG